MVIPKEVGEGLFGISFKMKGPPGAIKTTINPIRTITPRFIQKIIDKRKGRVEITDELGLNSDYLEALGFAWLAKERISNKTFNLSKVTGSQGPVSVGEIFLP